MKNYPIFYINLDKDEDRRSILEKALLTSGLIGERISGIWWKDLQRNSQVHLYSEQLNSVQYYAPLVDGEKGCYASHLYAWQKFLDTDAALCVVLEDDVAFGEDLAQVIAQLGQLQDNWDMIKLMGREQEKVAQSMPLTGIYKLIAYSKVPSYTAGYAISRSGAQKLLKSRRPFGRPIDIDLRFFWENDLRIFGVHPAPIHLNETSQSTTITDRKKTVSWRSQRKKILMKALLALGSVLHRHAPLPTIKNKAP